MNKIVFKIVNLIPKSITLISLLILNNFGLYSQSLSKNYDLVVNPKIPLTIAQYESGNFNPNDDLLESIYYTDGFDRISQILSKRQNPEFKDLVQIHEYDEFNRESKRYFSFFANQDNLNYLINPKTVQNSYYFNKYNDLTPFSEKKFDESPLNRVVEVSKGGDLWSINATNSHTDKFIPGTNSNNEISLFIIDGQGRIINLGFYQAQTLLTSIVKNENWKETGDAENDFLNTAKVFTDKNGKKIAEIRYSKEGTILKKLITQYVYDEKGLLLYILTPKTIDNLKKSNYITNGVLKFNYKLFLLNNVAGGGTDVTASITDGILSINFSAGFNSTPLKTGPIVYLSDQIPNTSLGIFNCTSCTTSNYKVYIENGYLCLGIVSYPISTTGFSGTYTANIGNNITFLSTEQLLDKTAYQYKYDNYNRKIEQKTPGKGWEYNIFDQLDRVILTQDANLKKQNLWQFIKYDAFERVVYTGKYQSSLLRNDLQIQADNFINGNSSNLSNIEERSSSISLGGTILNYSNSAFPKTDVTEISSISYYDDYNFTDSDKPIAPTTVDGQNVTIYTTGLLVANFRKTIDASSWTKNYSYYDQNTRPIYTFEKNYLGGYTKTETTFDFRGKIKKIVTKHKKDSNQLNDLLINDRYEYDHAERIIGEYQSVNSQPEVAIVKNIYDEIGSLKQKKIGGLTSSNDPLQLVSYTYNIRGWLTKINDPNAMGNSLFGLELKHENPTIVANTLYNGNISQVQWKNALPSSGLKTYNYQFDQLNQLSETQFINSNNNTHTTSFSEKISYDENGNITTLKRSGNVLTNPNLVTMDNLAYVYSGNQITKINESGDINEGYRTLNITLDTYEYDDNGNLIKDRNKGIESIVYNNLNLVREVLFTNGKKIKFNYDASGIKLSKEFINGGNSTVTNYIGGFQYLNGDLQFFPTSEGYAVKLNDSFKYVYIYGDHQGNNRLSYCDVNNDNKIDTTEIQSATDYYAYGMSHAGELVNNLASSYLYKLQGKEYNNEENLGLYDFGSRMYDPTIGRWMTPDPQNQFSSPYLALGNNPVLMTDPNGEWAGWDDVIAMAIGGTVNLVSNALSGNVHTWGDGFTYFGNGAVAGAATLYGGPAAGAAVLGLLNNVTDQYRANGNSFKNFDIGSTITAVGTSVATSAIGGAVGGQLTGVYGGMFSKTVENPLLKNYLIQTAASSSTGFVIGAGASLASGNTTEKILKDGGQAAVTSFLVTSVTYGASAARTSYQNKQAQKSAVAAIEAKQKEFYEIENKQKALNIAPKEAAGGLRNGHLAGDTHPTTDVPFDKNGFPDFTKHLYNGSKNDVMISPTGNRAADYNAANKAAGIDFKPKGYTWHHHQDFGRMQLIESNVHARTGHTGGFTLWKLNNLNKKL